MPTQSRMFAAFSVAAILSFPGTTLSQPLPTLDDAIDQLIAELKRSEPVEVESDFIDSDSRETIRQLWSHFQGSESPTANKLKDFLSSLPERKLIDAETARSLFQRLAPRATDEAFSELQAPLIMLLHPFVKEAGGCKPDPNHPGSELCMFASRPSGVDAIAQFTSEDFTLSPVVPAPETDLAYILTPDCEMVSADSTGSNNALPAAKTEPQLTTSNHLISSKCSEFDYWTTYGYRYEIKWYGTTRIWAEAFGFAHLGLSTSMADTIAANLPMALRCGYQCWGDIIFNCLGKLIRGETDEAVLCAARKGSKRAYTLHGDGSYMAHSTARGSCEIQQARATDREHFKAYQSGQYDGFFELPPEAKGFVNKDDLRFQTHYQKQPTSSTMFLDGMNMYPLPTRARGDAYVDTEYSALTSRPFWSHDFTRIVGWNFNIIFQAAEALPAYQYLLYGSRCRLPMTHPNIGHNLRVYGDQFQLFHGTPAELPEYNILVGWDTFHPAFTCTN